MNEALTPEQLNYLKLLGESYPTEEVLCTEIARLSANERPKKK